MKILKTIAIVAGAVALVATGLGAVGVGAVLGASTTAIAGIASLAAGVASIGANLLTKPPPARGSVTQILVDPDAPTPYAMGEGYFAGVLRYQRSYGATLDKVPNPYRYKVCVYSGGGPVQSITPYADQAAVGGYYSGYLYTGTKLGACPDTALVPNFSGAPGWGSTSKLSGKAAIGWNLKFDKNGKVFASGEPQLGAYGQWVKVYDPRLDSTRSGGSGSHRITNEATWAWSENPALHAATYAYGRYQNGKRVLGIGLPDYAIDWANVAAWANVCDTNSWRLFGVIYEPGDRWANLRDICDAGGAQAVLAAGALHFHYHAPRVSLDTITEADLLRDEEQGVVGRASWRDVLNTIVPKFRDPASNWELVPAGPVQVSTYLAADGEVKQAEWPFNFVKSLTQAAQLARYRLEQSREIQPIELVVGPRFRAYRPGDRLDLDLLDYLGLDTPAVILRREFDPAKLAVRLTLVGDTLSHAFALGQTTTAPPVPVVGQTSAQRDALAAEVIALDSGAHLFKSLSVDFPMYASTSTVITVNGFTGVLDDGRSITLSTTSLTGLTASTVYGVFWDIAGSAFVTAISPAATQMANSGLVFIGWQATPSGDGSFPSPGTAPQGYGGIGGNWAQYNVVI